MFNSPGDSFTMRARRKKSGLYKCLFEKKMTQLQFADAIGAPSHMVFRHVRNEIPLPLEFSVIGANILGITEAEFYSGFKGRV